MWLRKLVSKFNKECRQLVEVVSDKNEALFEQEMEIDGKRGRICGDVLFCLPSIKHCPGKYLLAMQLDKSDFSGHVRNAQDLRPHIILENAKES